MAESGLEKVILDGPLHEVVGDRGACNLLVVFDGFIVIAFEGCDVGNFQVEFVR